MAATSPQIRAASAARVNRVATKVSNPAQGTVPGELVVRFRPGVNAQASQMTMQQFGLTRIQSIGRPGMGIELVKVRPGVNAAQTLQTLRSHPSVQYAEPNYIVSIPPELAGAPLLRSEPVAYPNDPMFAQQYAHRVSNSLKGWEVTQGSERVVIAVVDTGVDLKHPDLIAKMVPGQDMVDGDDQAFDGHGHGTHCAGIAAAATHNQVGVAGFAPAAKIMPIRVLGDNGSGTSADVANGVIWAADNGAQVISMSLGSRSDAQVKAEAIQYALSKDAVVVAAMGNSSREEKSFPAATPGVIAVGATDVADKRANFSQYGSWISVSAPGVNILSTFPTSGPSSRKDYGSISGTSMATPAVAGAVALIRSQNPGLKVAQVRAQLEQGTDDLGDPGFDKYYGHGRINLEKILRPLR
jgi:thermitase